MNVNDPQDLAEAGRMLQRGTPAPDRPERSCGMPEIRLEQLLDQPNRRTLP